MKELSFESHIRQHEVLFKNYPSLFGLYKTDYSWILEFQIVFLCLVHASIQSNELVDSLNEPIVSCI